MKKKILVIDDSALMRRLVCDMINSDDRFEVGDTASNGEEGLNFLKVNSYDAVVMDMVMPRMDGLTVLRNLQKMRKHVRILVFSSETTEGAKITIEALELGAVDFIHKPSSIMGAKNDEFAKEFLDKLYEVSRAHLLFQAAPAPSATPRNVPDFQAGMTQPELMPLTGKSAFRGQSGDKIVAIASSTGGPRALQSVIPFLPGNLDAPVLVVQHMPPGFTASLAERLNAISRLSVEEAAEGMQIRSGHVYIAPGGKHMNIIPKGGAHVVHLTDGPHREGVKPCANFMYESLADCGYQNVVCVVMTGMGADGSEGISYLRPKKKCYVITQEQSTCAVYGMPRSAVTRGLSDEVEPLENLASAITKHVGVK
ncbi:MAG: chemotaxis response regulator protein-glutamate methylesterase [Lachnospiraceae bacterium]|nr:chemotaxis response regulator protein-glutamate methylesterase [Lachnospiraceae bacterium]